MTKHILLIDDNPDDLEFYSDLLENIQENYKVHMATCADEALLLFAQHSIYCTFIDYNLPGTNGIKILELLIDQSGVKVPPIVILTGEPNQTIQAEAARRGALNYIVKDSTNTPELLEAVIIKTVEWASDLDNSQRKVSYTQSS